MQINPSDKVGAGKLSGEKFFYLRCAYQSYVFWLQRVKIAFFEIKPD